MSDYLSEVYDWITKQDNTFSGDVNIESFQQKMQDDTYAKEMYNWMSSIDKTLPNDLSESDFINKVKKKDTSELQEAAAPEGIQDTPSTSETGQSSLAQKTQDSLNERLSGYKDLSEEDKVAFGKKEEKRSFYEDQGINYEDVLASYKFKEDLKAKKKKSKEESEDDGFFSSLYKSITSTEDLESDMFTTDEDKVDQYLIDNDDKIFEAEKNFSVSKLEEIKNTSTSQEDLRSKVKESGIDLRYIPDNNIKINDESTSFKELEKNLYDSDFIDKLQSGDVYVDINNPNNQEYLTYLHDLTKRQLEAGGQFGDIIQKTLAAGLDQLVAGPIELAQGLQAVGLDAIEGVVIKPFAEALGAEEMEYGRRTKDYMKYGSYVAKNLRDYSKEIREETRAYQEEGISKSLLKGNYSDAFFQLGGGVGEAVPLIASMYAGLPVLSRVIGPKAAGRVVTSFAGAGASGVKSLELKEQRLNGDIDIDDLQLFSNVALTFFAETYFEKNTLKIINSMRDVAKMGKTSAAKLADSYVKGAIKSAGLESSSEVATELSNVLTDAITGVGTPESVSDVLYTLGDVALISAVTGVSMHTIPYGAKALSDFSSLNDEIYATLTMENGDKKEMKRSEYINFIKDKSISQAIRDKKINVDASITTEGKNIINDLVYGHYSPDAILSREIMMQKEIEVQNLVSKIEETSKPKKDENGKTIKGVPPTPEDVSSIADALSKMEAEGKKNKYNVTSRTEATRARVGKFFKDSGIEIVDAVNDQDASMSTITETVESNSIETMDEYNAVEKQLEDGKRKPTIVKSQDQNGIKIKGENVQKSSITQGKFKSVSSARNAMKDFKAKLEANKNAKPTTEKVAKDNNKAFLNTKKEGLDKVPKKVIDSGKYHIISPDRSGITKAELESRMENTKADLEASGATVYTITEVVDGKAKQSLLVTNTTNAAALGTARNLQVESVFSGKDGILNTDGSVVPLDNSSLSGPEARRAGDVSIININGRKTSIHRGVDKSKTKFGKSFDSNNIHKLDESDPNYDKDLLDGVPSDRKRALGFAFKLLSSIGGLKVTVVRNSENMYKQLKALGYSNEKAAQGASSNAFFRGQDKSIYINLENVKGNTLFHEIVHPLVDFMKQNSPETYAKIEKEVSEGKVKRRYVEGGRRMKGTYLEWAQNHPFYSTLSKEAQIEEAFAEMIGDAAYGHFVDRNSRLGRLRALISEILSKIGVTVTDQPEKVSLDDLNLAGITKNLAGALVNGRSIKVGGVDFEVGDMKTYSDEVNKSIKEEVDKSEPNSDLGVVNVDIPDNIDTQELRLQASEYYPNFDVSKVKRGSIKDFNGQKALLMLTDRSASGMVVSPTGVKHEFDGGIFYPYQEDTGVWAFSDKAAAARIINAAKESDGLVFLTAMAPGSIDGSVNMFDYVMKELNQAIKDKRATKEEVLDFLNKKMTIKSFDSKAKDQGVKKSKVKSVKEFSNLVLSMPQAFGVRKDIIRKSIQSKIFQKWGIPSMDEIYKTVNQDIIRNLKGNPIVSAIRIDTDAGYIDSRTDESIKDHPTYPYVVKGEPLMIFDEAVDASEVWGELNLADKFLIDSRTGEKLSEGTTQSRRQRKIEMARPVVDIRMQAPTYDMEYTPNALISLSALSDNNRQPEQWVKEIGKGLKGASRDVDTMGLLELLKTYKKDAKVKSVPKEVVESLISTNMAPIETTILRTFDLESGSYYGDDYLVNYDDYSITEVTKDGDFKFKTPDGKVLNANSKSVGKYSVEEVNKNFDLKQFFVDKGLIDNGLYPDTEYKSFTLPGGKNYREFLIHDVSGDKLYKAPHYDGLGQNLIASARVDDRVGPNGEKILFVQEIQSDWVQKGIKEGFKISKAEQKLRNYYPSSGIENLPWNKTDLWVGLTIRKLINQASKEGYDQIAFVNGQQSDIIQGHGDGRTSEFYNKIVPKNIDKELKRLVKGMKYDAVNYGEEAIKIVESGMALSRLDFIEQQAAVSKEKGLDTQAYKSPNAVVNLTPELKAATDKVGTLRFQAPTLFNEPNPESADIARMYMNNNAGILGIIPDAEVLAVSQLDEVNSKMIADAYENLVDDPTNPEVRAAYEALADEIGLQYESILERGYNVEIWEGEGEPYANSAEMIEDVRDNKHMYIFGTEGGFGEAGITQAQRDANAMLADTPYTDVNGKQLVVNDLFRFVHDFFGHTEIGNGFGPVGEENAWLAHARMFSKPARLAMTTETRGQNSWVNFNESLRREDGSVPKRGDDDYIPLSERPFADQKMGLMAEEISYPKDLKYQVPTGGQTNVYKSGLAAIAWDIGMSVINADYAAGKYITGEVLGQIGFDKAKPRGKKQDRGYDVRLSTLIGKPLGTHSNEEIKEIMVRSKSELNRQLFYVDQNAKKLKKAIEGTDITSEEINRMLHNYEDIKAMNYTPIKEALIDMRRHIDQLSKVLIDEGLVKGQTQFTIDSNMGVYVGRSYMQFDAKNWKQKDVDIIQRLEDFLYNEAKKDNPEKTEKELQGIARTNYDELLKNKDVEYWTSRDANLAGLSRVNSIFKERKLIPEEIREFWGEIDNPLYLYSATAAKLARDISASRMYKELSEIGDGKFISNEQTPETFNKIEGSKWGVLQDKYVDNEMWAVINQIEKNRSSDWYAKAMDGYMKGIIFNKKMKTIYNPGTHAKNIIGNTGFAMMNGHLDFTTGTVFKNALFSIKAVKSMKNDELKEYYAELVSFGVVNSSASLQEIRGIAEDLSDNNFDFNDFTTKGKTVTKKIKESPKSFDNWVTELYQKEDDVWKIFGFEAEKARYIRAGVDPYTAKVTAAKNIRNTYPNYDQIPRVIRALGRNPFVGSFVAFQAEAVRNTKNSIQLGLEEIGSDNPKIAKIGVERLSSALFTATLFGSIQLHVAQFIGGIAGFLTEDDEDVESKLFRNLIPSWDSTGNISIIDKGALDTKQYALQTEGDTYVDYINYSSTSAIGYIKDVFRLAFTDVDTQAGKEAEFRVLKKIIEPFLGIDMTTSIVAEAIANKNNKVYKETDNWAEKLFKGVGYVGRKMGPGLAKTLYRIKEAAFDRESDLVLKYELLAVTGARITRVNVNKNLAINAYFINKDMIDRVGRSGMKDKVTVSKMAKENEDFNNDIDKLADIMSGAASQGLAGRDILNILRHSKDSKTRSGISEAVIMEAYKRHNEQYNPYDKIVE